MIRAFEADIPADRRSEFEGIVELLDGYAACDGAHDVALRIAAGSLVDGHLWRAMGLRDRAELRSLFETYFPEFAAGNDRDMRWKRYIYRRLCGWPGFKG